MKDTDATRQSDPSRPAEFPNAETLKTFRETDQNQNLKRFEKADDLFKDLGL